MISYVYIRGSLAVKPRGLKEQKVRDKFSNFDRRKGQIEITNY